MRMKAHCLTEDRNWRRRYFFSWITLTFYGCIAFALGEDGALAIFAQGLFFLAAFSIILWPICAAFQVDCDRYGQPKKRQEP